MPIVETIDRPTAENVLLNQSIIGLINSWQPATALNTVHNIKRKMVRKINKNNHTHKCKLSHSCIHWLPSGVEEYS